MRLCHNMNSLKVYNVYAKNLEASRKASQRLSSGLKINSEKDNPAKIGQLNKMEFQSKSLQAAQRNVQDGASMLQVSDGALQEVNNILGRMKELAVSASDGSKSEGDIEAIQDEIEQLKDNLDDISNNTEFNGVKLLGANDPNDNKGIVVGAMVGESDTIKFFNCSSEKLGIKDIDFLGDTKKNTNYINNIDKAIDSVNEYRGVVGAKSNVFNNLVDINDENNQLIESAASRIGDADIGEEVLEVSRTSLLVNAGLSLVAQTNRLPLDCLQIIQGARR